MKNGHETTRRLNGCNVYASFLSVQIVQHCVIAGCEVGVEVGCSKEVDLVQKTVHAAKFANTFTRLAVLIIHIPNIVHFQMPVCFRNL